MWYGLKENNKLVAVKQIKHYPSAEDFGVEIKPGKEYTVVVVRIREISGAI